MYRKFFGLNSLPFKTTPELEMFYRDGSREQILEALLYTISRGDGIVKVTGEVGSGKTMLLRLLASRLPSNTEIIYINSPNLSAKDILLYICNELHIDTSSFNEKFSLTNALQSKLVDLHGEGKRVVMLIDEAQVMTFDALEEVRLLSNIETNDDKLLQMVLFGQPELDVAMEHDKVRQIKSRISYSIYVPPLNAKEVQAYLNYRMRQAGYKGLDVFGLTVSKKICRLSEGLPRNINVIADKVLMSCFGAGDKVATKKHFDNIPDFIERKRSRIGLLVILSLMVITAAFFAIYVLLLGDNGVGDIAKNQQALTEVATPQLEHKEFYESPSVEVSQIEQGDELKSEVGDVPVSKNSVGLDELERHEARDSTVSTLDLTVTETEKAGAKVSDGVELERSPVKAAASDEVSPEPLQSKIKVETDRLNQPFLTLHQSQKLEKLLQHHLNAKEWLLAEGSRYVVQLSTRNIASLETTLNFYQKYKINFDNVNILIDFNPDVGVFRLKVYYLTSNSFSDLSKKIDALPDKVKMSAPFVRRVDRLKKNLVSTEQKLQEVGIINE